jgi:nucleoside-triphosphatase THEP1
VAGRLVVVEVNPEVGSLLGAVRHVARLVRRALVGDKRVVVTLRRPQNHPASHRLDLKCVRAVSMCECAHVRRGCVHVAKKEHKQHGAEY